MGLDSDFRSFAKEFASRSAAQASGDTQSGVVIRGGVGVALDDEHEPWSEVVGVGAAKAGLGAVAQGVGRAIAAVGELAHPRLEPKIEHAALLETLDAALRPRALVGASSAGEFTGRARGDGACAMALRSTAMKVTAAIGRGLSA
ncbi:hypothetical protein B4Q13_19435, partial [Lacticaseibacillus rhamnosus]